MVDNRGANILYDPLLYDNFARLSRCGYGVVARCLLCGHHPGAWCAFGSASGFLFSNHLLYVCYYTEQARLCKGVELVQEGLGDSLVVGEGCLVVSCVLWLFCFRLAAMEGRA
jgi:hypothetical protein